LGATLGPGRICTTKRRRSISARQPDTYHAGPNIPQRKRQSPKNPENNPLVLDRPFFFLHLFLADPWAPAWLTHHWLWRFYGPPTPVWSAAGQRILQHHDECRFKK
jgi:hypothetical protein